MPLWTIEPVAAERRLAALLILHDALPLADRQARAQADLERIVTQATNEQALFVAKQQDTERLLGACWIELQAGSVGYVHPPVALLTEPERTVIRRDLYQAAEAVASQCGVTWLQALLEERASPATEFLASRQFRHLSTLSYQACLAKHFPEVLPETRFTAVSYRDADRELFASVVTATYTGSLDAPALDGERNIDAVLASYQMIGSEGSGHWQLIVRDGQAIGCLCLAIHRPENDPTRPFGELVYWGLLPAARGQGLGRAIVELALWQMRTLGMVKLLLAVDERNAPAIAIYQKLGFFEWLQRHAWGKSLSATNTSQA